MSKRQDPDEKAAIIKSSAIEHKGVEVYFTKNQYAKREGVFEFCGEYLAGMDDYEVRYSFLDDDGTTEDNFTIGAVYSAHYRHVMSQNVKG